MSGIKSSFYRLLRSSEKYTKTDMVYLFQSSFWMQSGSILVSFASFLLYIVFANVLTKDLYGTYQYLLSVATIVSAFTLTGMSPAVTRAVARGFEGAYRQSIRIQLLWGLIPLLGAWAMGAYYFAHGNLTLGYGLALIGVFVPLNTTFNTYSAYLLAKKDFKRNFLYSLFVNVPYYLAMVSVAFSLPTAFALLTANLISQGLGYYLAHRRVLTTFTPNNTKEPGAMRYGANLSLMRFFGAAIAKADDLLVFHFLGAVPLALYSIATAVPDRLGIFKSLGSAAFPKYAQKSHSDILSSLRRKTVISIGFALCIAFVYILFAHFFFALFFPQYLVAVSYSQVYVFIIAVSFGYLYVTALTAQGHTKALYIYNIISPLILISCEVVGIITWGIWGLVLGKLIATLLSSILSATLLFLSQSSSSPNVP